MGACDYKANFEAVAEETRRQTALIQSMLDNKVNRYEHRQMGRIGEWGRGGGRRRALGRPPRRGPGTPPAATGAAAGFDGPAWLRWRP